MLALKFGHILANSVIQGTTSTKTLRIQLHASCLPLYEDEEQHDYQHDYQHHYQGKGVEEDYPYDDAIEPTPHEDLEAAVLDGVEYGIWEGEWNEDVRLLSSA